MYAGRYLWWNMLAVGLFLFFSIYFYYFGWLAIRVSGCGAVIGQCGALEGRLNETIRPGGLLFAGILVLTSTVLRIHYLKISPLWGLALFVWFGASSDFFFLFGNLWMANIGIVEIARLMPVEALFLIALTGFLCFPLELYRDRPKGALNLVYYVTGFTASYSFCFSIAKSTILPEWIRRITGSEQLAGAVHHFQLQLQKMLGLGHDGIMPLLIAFAIFASTLSYFIVMRNRPMGAPA